MINWVIRDYFEAFRWQNVKERLKNFGWWFYIYFLTLLPLSTGQYITMGRIITYWLLMIPVLFCMLTSTLYPMALPKMMYLSPMSYELRREYIVKACRVRTITPIMLGILGITVLLTCGMFDWMCGVGMLLNITIFSILLGSGINTAGYGKILDNGQRAFTIDNKYILQEVVCLVVTMVINIIYVAMDGEPVDWWVKVSLIAVILLIPLPLTVSYMKHWTDAVERAVSYESSGAVWREREKK